MKLVSSQNFFFLPLQKARTTRNKENPPRRPSTPPREREKKTADAARDKIN